MGPRDSIVFDRVADRYDETRGGEERGRTHAAAVASHLDEGSALLEIGVGTGLIAGPLDDAGHRLVGVDLSRAMLDQAAHRTSTLVEGDAAVLPFGSHTFDAVVAVWALHVVGDQDALVAEIERVVRPGGRLVAVSPRAEIGSTDVTDLAYGWARLRNKPDGTIEVLDRLVERGWTRAAIEMMPWETQEETPLFRADSIESRVWSSLWEMDDDTWHRYVQPAIDGLRALPDPDQPRPVRMRYPLWVIEAPDG